MENCAAIQREEEDLYCCEVILRIHQVKKAIHRGILYATFCFFKEWVNTHLLVFSKRNDGERNKKLAV